ncbi:hypothetical protein [Glaciecola sp. MF2-115]|uniref:hypothetical protein n=1 Tax=Glaciecola sp. MF2-115 TaxID=3384827 RepID=UPI0039A3A45D
MIYKQLIKAKSLNLLAVLVLFSSVSNATQTTPESEALIEELVKQISSTMIAVVDAEKKAGKDVNDLHITLDIPGKHSPNLGLILNVDDKKGFRVLNVTPGSLAESLEIRQGDLIAAINGVSPDSSDKKVVFAELENTLPGDTIIFDVYRNGVTKRIEALVEGQYTPAIKLEIGESSAKNEQESSVEEQEASASNKIEDNETLSESSVCGVISTFFKPPETRNLYSVFISQIGERKILSSNTSYKLPPGKHVIRVHEAIDDPFFKRYTRSTVHRGQFLDFEIEVKENTTYYLAAEFNRNARFKERTGDYWKPVVWRVREDRPCEL